MGDRQGAIGSGFWGVGNALHAFRYRDRPALI